MLVVLRPPPETSAYHAHNPLYDAVLDRILRRGGRQAVVIPRTEGQRDAAGARRGRARGRPERAIDAQSLIAYADLVVSAGGTMNREAVALGTPVYTIFSGRMGAVDEPDRAGPAAAARERRRSGRSESASARSACKPRDAGLLVDGILEAVGPRCS